MRMAMEGVNQGTEVILPRLWSQTAVVEGRLKLAPNIVSGAEVGPEHLEELLHHCEGVFRTERQVKNLLWMVGKSLNSQFPAPHHVRNKEHESMPAKGKEDTCLIKDSPHSSGNLVDHVLPPV